MHVLQTYTKPDLMRGGGGDASAIPKKITIPTGSGAKSISGSVRFDSRVLTSEFLVGGFKFNFASQDHHMDEIEINFVRLGSSPPDPNAVQFLLECRYQDKNGDDRWNGHVELVVVADVE